MEDYRHYAINEAGERVYVEKFNREERHQTKYYCIACGEEMIPVLGEVREKHFRHKQKNPNCTQESYIHKLGKQKLKERFYEQESFNVTYIAEIACEKAGECVFAKKNKSLQCNSHNRIKKTIDLKKLYDTCEEEREYKGFRADLILTHSEHPEREPVFLEIAFTHDCELEKIQSGIQIIEIKVEDDNGFSVPLEEQDTMLKDLSLPNPYTEELPPVRFFNFNRKQCSPIQLRRFVVFTPKEEEVRRFCLLPNKHNITCQDESLQKETIIDYELLAPAEIVKDENKFCCLGIAAAAKRNLIKSCYTCSRHNTRMYGGCYLTIPQEVEIGGKKYQQMKKYWTSSFSNEQLDREKQASICTNYSPNIYWISNEISKNNDIPYLERIKKQ